GPRAHKSRSLPAPIRASGIDSPAGAGSAAAGAGGVHARFRNESGSQDQARVRSLAATTTPSGTRAQSPTATWSIRTPGALEVKSGSANRIRSKRKWVITEG